jgi:hypothetical protein
MPETLLVLGGILGLTLSGLLASTIAFDKFKFWPTPGPVLGRASCSGACSAA